MEQRKPPFVFLFVSFLLLTAIPLLAGEGEGDVTDCSVVAEQVRAAVSADPSKVLLIVEDAVVTNETCVCHIIKAAISASNANADLVRQILLTATNIAPKMSAMIEACIEQPQPQQGDGGKQVSSIYSGKETQTVYSGKAPSPVYASKQPEPIAPIEDYTAPPVVFRGVYLLAPSTGGIYIERRKPKKPDKYKAVSTSVAKYRDRHMARNRD